MPIVDFDRIEPDRPELVFGLVAAVGTPLEHFMRLFSRDLQGRGYRVDAIHASHFMRGLNLEMPFPAEGASEFDRINVLMDLGDELREKSEESLILLVASHIQAQRPDKQPRHLAGRGFVIRQLKHPAEVVWLRKIYRSACQVVALYCPRRVRKRYLEVEKLMSGDEAERLIRRDEGEDKDWGQQLRKTFHLADVFIEIRAFTENDDYLANQIRRYLDLLFGAGVISPTPEEYGMAHAATAALRSLDLSRQVGASILTKGNELIAVGANEVPAPGGGQYWGHTSAKRDCEIGYDSNDVMKQQIIREVLSKTDVNWSTLDDEKKRERLTSVAALLEDARVMNLTEFGRAVHAEMEAIISAARCGMSPRGCSLFTTTFPCHNCAKHIIDAGIERVIYIEPYPKSLAAELHEDALALVEEDGDKELSNQVRFVPFLGVAPRSYHKLFSSVTEEGRRLERKDKHGTFKENSLGLRAREPSLSYIDRETQAAVAVQARGELSAQLELADSFKGDK